MSTYIPATSRRARKRAGTTPAAAFGPPVSLSQLASHQVLTKEQIDQALVHAADQARVEFASTHIRTIWVSLATGVLALWLALAGEGMLAGYVVFGAAVHVWSFRMTRGRLEAMQNDAARRVRLLYRSLTTDETHELVSLSRLDPQARDIVQGWVNAPDGVRWVELDMVRRWSAVHLSSRARRDF